MTLATIPRYDSSRISAKEGHAVVVGASIAGLCAARVLTDMFDEVTIIDRDLLPDEAVVRRGVPQAPHTHVLWEAGRATVEDLLPGYSEDLIEAGGLLLDAMSDLEGYFQGGFLAPGTARVPMYSATRPLFEQTLRRHVSELEGVSIESGCQFFDYLTDDAAKTVTGVVVREGDSEPKELTADLVVDATGRTSRTPRWLKQHGYTPPVVDIVNLNIAYSTLFIDRPADDHRAIVMPAEAPRTRGGFIFPVEDDRWQVNLHGMHGDHPPTDAEGFADFAASLPTPIFKQFLDEHRQVSDEITHYPYLASRRHRYEDLNRFPTGLVVIGDAIASFDPIYGQGMSVAALEAVVLHHTLASSSHEDLALTFFDRAAEVIDGAWMLALGGDLKFPQTDAPKPRGTDFVNWYLARLLRRAHTDGELTNSFVRVLSMQQPPTTLLHPKVVWRVFRPAG